MDQTLIGQKLVVEPKKLYDAIAFNRNADAEDEDILSEQKHALSFLRPFTELEKARAIARFSTMKAGVWIVMGAPKGGWDSSLYPKKNRILVDKCTILRSYRNCCEMLPKDFDWELADDKIGLWGGTLKDHGMRMNARKEEAQVLI